MIKNIFRTIKPSHLLILLAAGCINSVAVTMFLAPVNLYDSGISGTSMLIAQLTPEWFSLSLCLVLLNLPLFFFGFRKQGVPFTVYSVWTVCVYSAASWLIVNALPVDVSTASPFAGRDLILCALFGGLISGVGSGLTIRFGGAIDGIEVMVVIFAKKLGLTVGTFVMLYNVALYLIIGCVFSSWILPLYSIIAYCAAIKSIDFIVEGLDKAKSAMIITTREDAVCRALSDAFGHGITQLHATGYYSNTSKTVIYFVINRFQIAKLKSIVAPIDPDAFITISEVSDVLGSSLKADRTE